MSPREGNWSDETREEGPPVPLGTLLGGKYRLEHVLARGGMGVIVAATHELLGQAVAIKFLLPQRASDEAIARLLREARVAATLESEHVVRVHDADTTDDGIPYVVMERLEGHDLGRELAMNSPLPIARAVGYVIDVLAALGEAHSHGIVHRDLKPANVFLARQPDGTTSVRVLDFGISKMRREAGVLGDATLTGPGTCLGSPRYMSPEQIKNPKDVDLRTDIWSAGVLLYELLSSQRAFDGEGVGEIFTKIREEELPRLRRARPDVPAALDAVVARCLRRDRALRYASAGELAAALAPFAKAGAEPRRPASSRRRVVATLAALGILAAVTAVLWAGGRAPDTAAGAIADQGPPSGDTPHPGPVPTEPRAEERAAGAAAPEAPEPPVTAAPHGAPARPRPAATGGPVTKSKLLKTRE